MLSVHLEGTENGKGFAQLSGLVFMLGHLFETTPHFKFIFKFFIAQYKHVERHKPFVERTYFLYE
jgi:hypothetical protein